jgi:hypothetical protein
MHLKTIIFICLPYLQHEGLGGAEVELHTLLTSALDGGEWSNYDLAT